MMLGVGVRGGLEKHEQQVAKGSSRQADDRAPAEYWLVTVPRLGVARGGFLNRDIIELWGLDNSWLCGAAPHVVGCQETPLVSPQEMHSASPTTSPSPDNQKVPPNAASLLWGKLSPGEEHWPRSKPCDWREQGGQLASPRMTQGAGFKVYLTRAESSVL